MYPRDPQCNVRFYLLASTDQGTSSDPINTDTILMRSIRLNIDTILMRSFRLNTDTILMRSFRLNIDTIQAWNEDGAGIEKQRNISV